MSRAGLLVSLTFIGGTCLRACYGSSRLSEDLVFTGGAQFSRESLSALAQVLVESLQRKYGLSIEVSEPTRAGQHDLPAQRINIDICAIPDQHSDRLPAQDWR